MFSGDDQNLDCFHGETIFPLERKLAAMQRRVSRGISYTTRSFTPPPSSSFCSFLLQFSYPLPFAPLLWKIWIVEKMILGRARFIFMFYSTNTNSSLPGSSSHLPYIKPTWRFKISTKPYSTPSLLYVNTSSFINRFITLHRTHHIKGSALRAL